MDKNAFVKILTDRLEKNKFTVEEGDGIIMVNKNNNNFEMNVNEMFEGYEIHGYSFIDGLMDHLLSAIDHHETKLAEKINFHT